MTTPDKRYGFSVARISSEWFYPLSATTSNNLAFSGNNEFRCAPWVADSSFTLAQIQMDIIAAGDAGCTVRPVIYQDAGFGAPGNLVLDAGTLPGDAIALPVIAGLSASISAGILYWLGAIVQGAPAVRPTIRCLGSGTIQPFALRYGTTTPVGAPTPFGYLTGGIVGSAPLQAPAMTTANFAPRMAFRTA